MLKNLAPYIARLISSDFVLDTRRKAFRTIRTLRKKTRSAKVFLKLDDPYSYLLLQALAEFNRHYTIELNFYILDKLPEDMYPEQKKWNENAFKDCVRLAGLYDMGFPQAIPAHNLEKLKLATLQLVEQEQSTNFIERALVIYSSYWFDDPDFTAQATVSSELLSKRLQDNYDNLLNQDGYLSASIYFEGEFYWGIDRLYHLENRLNKEDRAQDPSLYFNRQNQPLPDHLLSSVTPSKQSSDQEGQRQKLTMYFSIRSPYSYLGLEKAVKLTEKYDLELDVKVVLPMVMRGLSVPTNKKWYIFEDNKREAKAAGIDYGFVADPLGKGVENCYAILEYAKQQNAVVPYLLSYTRSVNAMGIRSDTERGLQEIVSNAGLSWEKARQFLDDDRWHGPVRTNKQELDELGLWGVPCFYFAGETRETVWGQDRLWYIEKLIVKQLLQR